MKPLDYQRRTTAQRSAPWSLPQLSVVLPVYGQADTVLESAGSVLQDCRYPLELIVIDDGSGPELRRALEPLLGDSRVIYRYQDNQGLAAALNAGARLARGRFLSWTSADNYFHSHALERMADFLMSNPAVGLAYANYEVIDADGSPAGSAGYRPQNQLQPGSPKLHLPSSGESLGADADNFIGPCHLLRSSIRRAVGDVDPRLRAAEDFDYWLRCSLCTSLWRIDSRESWYSYRLQEDSISARVGAQAVRAEAELVTAEHKQRRRHWLQYYREASAKDYSPAALAKDFGLECSEVGGPAAPQGALSEILCREKQTWRIESEVYSASALVPPPIERRVLLLRARDGDYRSIDAGEESALTTLFFCPDSAPGAQLTCLAGLIAERRRCTFVLLCENAAQREFADAVNLSLSGNRNLRIVDLRNECALGRDAFEHSLMYLLSNCDCITALFTGRVSFSALLNLRLQLVAAAHAGIAVHLILDPGAIAAAESPAGEFFEELCCSPHLAIELLNSQHVSPKVHRAELIQTTPYNLSTLDEWLHCSGHDWTGKVLAYLSVAKRFAKR